MPTNTTPRVLLNSSVRCKGVCVTVTVLQSVTLSAIDGRMESEMAVVFALRAQVRNRAVATLDVVEVIFSAVESPHCTATSL